MKNFKFIFSLLILVFLSISTIATTPNNFSKGNDTIQIKTSAVCGMCKKAIEGTLAFERGVKSSNLDIPSQIVTVVYDARRTNPDKIKKAISKVGYDADEIMADSRAYDRLDDCCKKDMMIHD